MADASVSYDADALRRRILTLRGQKVILDTDLAGLYGVEVKRLNEQVKRNRDRFPEDFIFQLTAQETADLKSQVAISSEDATDNRDGSRKDASRLSNWSQFATSSAKHRGLTYRP